MQQLGLQTALTARSPRYQLGRLARMRLLRGPGFLPRGESSVPARNTCI